MKARQFLILFFIFFIPNLIFSDSIPITGSGNKLTINLSCSTECSGSFYLIKESANTPFWGSINRDTDFNNENSYIFQNFDSGEYILAIRDNNTKELGWLLDNGSIAYNCPLPLPVKTFSFNGDTNTHNINIDFSKSIHCCSAKNFQSLETSNFSVNFSNIESDNFTGKIFIIPDNNFNNTLPIEMEINSTNITGYLPEGNYYIWAYINERGSVKTTDGWSNLSISGNENEISLNFDKTAPTLNIEFSDVSFFLKNRWLLIFRQDNNENWKLFFSKKVFFENKDIVQLNFLPPGTYKIGFINSAQDNTVLDNFDLINYYSENGVVHSLNEASSIDLNTNTTVVFNMNLPYRLDLKILNAFDDVMTMSILADVFLNGKYVDTLFKNPSLFSTAVFTGLEDNETVEIKFIKDNFFKKNSVSVKGSSSLNINLNEMTNKVSGKIYNNNTPLLLSKIVFYNPTTGEELGYTWTGQDGTFSYYFSSDVSGVIIGLWINGNFYFLSSNNLTSQWEKAKIYAVNNDYSINISKTLNLNETCQNSVIIFSANYYDFGSVSIGYESTFQLEVFNQGGSDVFLDNLTFLKNDSNVFEISNNYCSKIAPLESCIIKFNFIPQKIESYTGSIAFNFDNNSVKIVKFTGKGIALAPDNITSTLTSQLEGWADDIEKIEEGNATQATIDNVTSEINDFIKSFYNATRGINALMDSGQTIAIATLNELLNNYTTLTSYTKVLINANANVDLETLSKTFPFFENFSNNLVDTEDEQSMDNIFKSSLSMTSQLNDISNNATQSDELQDILSRFDKTVNSGITAAIIQKVTSQEITGLIEDVGELITNSLDKAQEISTPQQLSEIINTSGESLGNIFNNISQLKTQMETQTKTDIINKVKNITQTITQKIVDSVSAVAKDKFQKTDVKEIKTGVSEIASNLLSVTENGIDKDNIELFKNLSKNLIDKISDDINLSDNAFSDESSISSEQLLEIIDYTAIDITNGIVSKPSAVELNLDNNTSNQIIQLLPSVASPSKTIFSADNETVTSQSVVEKNLKNYYQSIKVETNNLDSSAQITVDNFTIPTFISKTSIISSELDGNLVVSPKGNIMLINNGVTDELTPAPVDSISFLYTLISQLQLDNNSLKLNPDGTLEISIDNNTFVCSFSYIITKNPSFSIGDVSFTISGTDPTTESYQLLVNYSDGSTQQLTPYIYEIDAFDELVENIGLTYLVDRSTGIVTITGSDGSEMRLLPDFNFIPLSIDEQNWFKDNQYLTGIALKVEDKNNDGKDDIIFYTESGSQILYVL
jgi:hypothetical protein